MILLLLLKSQLKRSSQLSKFPASMSSNAPSFINHPSTSVVGFDPSVAEVELIDVTNNAEVTQSSTRPLQEIIDLTNDSDTPPNESSNFARPIRGSSHVSFDSHHVPNPIGKQFIDLNDPFRGLAVPLTGIQKGYKESPIYTNIKGELKNKMTGPTIMDLLERRNPGSKLVYGSLSKDAVDRVSSMYSRLGLDVVPAQVRIVASAIVQPSLIYEYQLDHPMEVNKCYDRKEESYKSFLDYNGNSFQRFLLDACTGFGKTYMIFIATLLRLVHWESKLITPDISEEQLKGAEYQNVIIFNVSEICLKGGQYWNNFQKFIGAFRKEFHDYKIDVVRNLCGRLSDTVSQLRKYDYTPGGKRILVVLNSDVHFNNKKDWFCWCDKVSLNPYKRLFAFVQDEINSRTKFLVKDLCKNFFLVSATAKEEFFWFLDKKDNANEGDPYFVINYHGDHFNKIREGRSFAEIFRPAILDIRKEEIETTMKCLFVPEVEIREEFFPSSISILSEIIRRGGHPDDFFACASIESILFGILEFLMVSPLDGQDLIDHIEAKNKNTRLVTFQLVAKFHSSNILHKKARADMSLHMEGPLRAFLNSLQLELAKVRFKIDGGVSFQDFFLSTFSTPFENQNVTVDLVKVFFDSCIRYHQQFIVYQIVSRLAKWKTLVNPSPSTISGPSSSTDRCQQTFNKFEEIKAMLETYNVPMPFGPDVFSEEKLTRLCTDIKFIFAEDFTNIIVAIQDRICNIKDFECFLCTDGFTSSNMKIPCITSCCLNKAMCSACIQRLKKNNQPCPFCRAKKFGIQSQDKSLEKENGHITDSNPTPCYVDVNYANDAMMEATKTRKSNVTMSPDITDYTFKRIDEVNSSSNYENGVSSSSTMIRSDHQVYDGRHIIETILSTYVDFQVGNNIPVPLRVVLVLDNARYIKLFMNNRICDLDPTERAIDVAHLKANVHKLESKNFFWNDGQVLVRALSPKMKQNDRVQALRFFCDNDCGEYKNLNGKRTHTDIQDEKFEKTQKLDNTKRQGKKSSQRKTSSSCNANVKLLVCLRSKSVDTMTGLDFAAPPHAIILATSGNNRGMTDQTIGRLRRMNIHDKFSGEVFDGVAKEVAMKPQFFNLNLY